MVYSLLGPAVEALIQLAGGGGASEGAGKTRRRWVGRGTWPGGGGWVGLGVGR